MASPSTTPPAKRKRSPYSQKYSEKWEDDVKFKGWLSKSSKGSLFYHCKACNYDGKAGKSEIERHAGTVKHVNNVKRLKNTRSVLDMPSVSGYSKTEKLVKEGEIRLAAVVSELNLPFAAVDRLLPVIKAMCPDSVVAKTMKCGKTKCSAIVKNVLGRKEQDDLLDLLRNNCFSLIVDESTDRGCIKHLALVARVTTVNGVKDMFLTLVPLESATASSLYEHIKSVFRDADIPYKEHMLGFAADGANVMMGVNNSLSTLLKQDIPYLFVMKCICHSFHLCASYACKKLPRWVEDLARDTHNYFLSPKQSMAFKEFQEFVNVKPHKILHPSQTRWLSLHSVVKRLLEQLPALKLFFTKAVLEDRLEAAQSILQKLNDPCTLHFMMSHSVDLFPHAGLDYVWENPRMRRDVGSQNRYGLPISVEPANHPIENGVIWTPAGPVAAGTLLAGIMITDTSQGQTISQIYQSQSLEFMPDEMQQKRVMPLYAVTLSGDIGQTAVVGYLAKVGSNNVYLGPTGMFANSTAAPKLYTLERNYDLNVPYLTRAEVFAGIDSLLIQKVLKESSNNQLSLSQALRMYYSDHGLPGYPDYKACNRIEAFKSLDLTVIQDQALNYMYAYSAKIPAVRDKIREKRDDFTLIERYFKEALGNAWTEFINFVDNYDYSEYDQCSSSTSNQPMNENKVDLLVVYGYEGGETETQKQRDYISHLGQLLNVGVDRSRIGVMDGKSAKFMFPMANFSNVADWGSNFSESTMYSYGSGSNMPDVMDALDAYYFNFYKNMWSDASNASAYAQVVLWNAPNSVPDQDMFKQLMDDFVYKYPNVHFLFVGKGSGSFNDYVVDPTKDYFRNTGDDSYTFAKKIAKRIDEIPTVFTYPACDPTNGNFTNYAESSHVYTGYVSPNYTTFIKIAPTYFRFSEKIIVKVTDGDVAMCGSRTSMNVDDNVDDRLCDPNNNLEWWYLCGRWIGDCDPIYLAVTGSNTRSNIYCQDPECQYPNQIKFQIQHEGMTCGAWSAPPSLLLLAVAVLTMLLQPKF